MNDEIKKKLEMEAYKQKTNRFAVKLLIKKLLEKNLESIRYAKRERERASICVFKILKSKSN